MPHIAADLVGINQPLLINRISSAAMLPPGFTLESPSCRTTSRSFLAMDVDAPNHHPHAPVVVDSDADAVRKLIAQDVVPLRSPDHAYATHTEYASFRGLYVVQSPTEARHVRYAMDISVPQLQLHIKCAQRYSAFYMLRQRLLKSLKQCQVDGARPTLSDSLVGSFDLAHLRHPCCAGCAHTRRQLKAVPFPKRALLFTSVDDVDARVPVLEVFLDACFKALVDWRGCARGRKFLSVVLGRFLSFNLLYHIYQQRRLTIVDSEATSNAETPRKTHVEPQDATMEPHEPPHHRISNQVDAL